MQIKNEHSWVSIDMKEERLANANDNIILYMHAGSKNHGCEAIVNTVCHMLEAKYDINQRILVTYRKNEDELYSLKTLCTIIEERKFENHKFAHIFYYIYRKITKDKDAFMRYRYKDILKKPARVAVSIGGDNYCYEDMLNDLKLSNNVFNKSGMRTILFGCSIEPELIDREDIKKDLEQYDAIIARESITYDALKNKLRGKEDKIFLYPDPAFTLGYVEKELPSSFISENIVGINISPMILNNEKISGMTLKAYKNLICYITENTKMQIALIPHVVWESNDDREAIKKLYDFIPEQYRDRVCIIPDGSAEELKGYIRRCRFFVGARTHSTIAAYSSMVPTLVVGYSVKARGIAKDLFTDFDVNDLVVPVQNIDSEDILVEKFKWMVKNEQIIREELENVIPDYSKRALKASEILLRY